MFTGEQDIQQRTVYSDDVIAHDALFDIFASATLVLTGDDAFATTSFALAGETRNLGAASLDDAAFIDGSIFVNVGSVRQSGEVSLGASAGDVVVVRNLGEWDVDGDEDIVGFAGDRFVNLGDFVQASSTLVTTISADFIDYGDLDFKGTLDFAGANTLINSAGISGWPGNVIDITAGFARFRFLTAPNASNFDGLFGALNVSDGAKVGFLGNAALQASDFTLGTVNISAGGIMLIGASTTAYLEGELDVAGIVRGAGDFMLSTRMDLQDGARVLVGGSFIACDVTGRAFFGAPGADPEMSSIELNAGTLVTDGLTLWNNMEDEAISGQGRIVNAGVSQLYGPNAFAVDGDINIVNADELDLGGPQSDVNVSLTNGATITNLAGAKLILESEQSFIMTGGKVVNYGDLAMQSTPSVQNTTDAAGVIASLVVNNGDISSGAGLEFQAAVTGTGDDSVTTANSMGSPLPGAPGQGLTFDAAVDAGQTIHFTGADQLLTLNDIGEFQAQVSGFDMLGGGDSIAVDTSVWTFDGFTANAAGTGGTLGFTDYGAEIGGSVAQISLTLSGDYAASGFQASTSGSKTTITYS